MLRYNLRILDLNMESLPKLRELHGGPYLERDDFHNRYTSGQSISLHEFLYRHAGSHPWSSSADVELG